MMIKSFFCFLSTYLIFLPMIVGSLPLSLQKVTHAALRGRYLGKQTSKRFFRRLGGVTKSANVRTPWVSCSSRKDDWLHKARGSYGSSNSLYLSCTTEPKGKWRGTVRMIRRGDLLDEIKEAALKGNVVITGSSGSGKTCLLRDSVELLQHKFSDIIWINASNEEVYCDSLRMIASRIGLENVDHESMEVVKNFVVGYGERGGQLFVYDNLDRANLAWLLPIKNSKLIITSEDDDWGYDYHKVRANSLTLQEIERFLREQEIAFLPEKIANLLVSESMATINRVVSYLTQYNPLYENFYKLLSGDEGVKRTIHRLHLETLEKDRKLLRILGMICYVNPNAFIPNLLQDSTMGEMVDSGLLSDDSISCYFGIGSIAGNSLDDEKKDVEEDKVSALWKRTDLLRYYAIDKDFQESIKGYVPLARTLEDAIVFCIFGEWYEYSMPHTWEKMNRHAGDIARLWEHVKGSKNSKLILEMLPIMSGLGRYYLEVRYDLKQAEGMLKEVLGYVVTFDKSEDEHDSLLANIHWSLGRVKMEQGDLSGAVAYLKDALVYDAPEIREDIYCSLAEAYLEKGMWSLYKKCITEALKAPNEAQFVHAKICRVQGLYHAKNMKFYSASNQFEHGLELLGDKEHPFKIALYYTVLTLKLKRVYGRSDNTSNRIQKLLVEYFPYHHKWNALYYYQKSLMLFNDGKYVASKDAVAKALTLGEKIWAKDHVHNMHFSVHLGKVHGKLGEYEEALKRFDDALVSSIKTDHAEMQGLIYLGIGNLCRLQGFYPTSLFYMKRSLELIEGIYPKDDLMLGEAKFFLGLVYKDLGENDLAKELLNGVSLIYNQYWMNGFFSSSREDIEDALKSLR